MDIWREKEGENDHNRISGGKDGKVRTGINGEKEKKRKRS